jgi:hypothetical protein
MLNPLPVAEHATKPDPPAPSFNNHHTTPEPYMHSLAINSTDDREASPSCPSPTRAFGRSFSSPPISDSHSTPRHAILSPLRDALESPPLSRASSPASLQRTAEYNVSLNRKTTLNTLYRYPLGAVVEYPETSSEGCVGHLFDVLPDDWLNP